MQFYILKMQTNVLLQLHHYTRQNRMRIVEKCQNMVYYVQIGVLEQDTNIAGEIICQNIQFFSKLAQKGYQ